MRTGDNVGLNETGAAIRHCVIAAHPEPHSFTMAVAHRYCEAVADQGQQPVLRDLYPMGFDPLLKADEILRSTSFQPRPDVAAELDLLADAAAIVLIYPIWFGTPPAIIKGYVERVLGAGASPSSLTHHLGQSIVPRLSGKRLLSFTSSGASQEWLSEQGAWAALETVFDGYIARAFWMDTPQHVHFAEVTANLDPAIAERHFSEVEKKTVALCRELAARKPTASPP